MSYIIRDNEMLAELAALLTGNPGPHAAEFGAALAGGEIELAPGAEFSLDIPLVLGMPLRIKGNGAVLSGKAPCAVMICSGNTEVSELTLNGYGCAVNIDAMGGTADGISLRNLTINDPGYGVCINIGSSKSNSSLRNILISGCTLNSGYSREFAEESGIRDGAMGFNIAAACPQSALTEDLENAEIDGLVIDDCHILGARRFGINMLVGVEVPSESSDYLNQQSVLRNNAIRNVKILRCEFDWCFEGGISLMCGCIKNYGSICENLEVAYCRIVSGLLAVAISGAGPVVPTSVSRSMGVRHCSIHDNDCRAMDMDIGEPNYGIVIQSARAEGYAGIEVYDCFVEDVDIVNNTVTGNAFGIGLVAANALTDERICLSGNYVRNIRITGNKLSDVETAFQFYAAYAEGRRFDWNWGWRKVDQNWAPLLSDHTVSTAVYKDNFISDIVCRDNLIDGCRYEVCAAGACGKGHALMTGNRISDEIIFENNTFTRSENHIRVMDSDICDWVSADGNSVSAVFKN